MSSVSLGSSFCITAAATLIGIFIADNTWCDVGCVFILRIVDFDEVWHNLGNISLLDLGSLHNLHLESNNTLAEFDRSYGLVDEIILWLTGRYLVTLSVLLSLGTLSTDLTRDDDFATNGTTASHNCSKNVVSGETDWGST